ncbi:D-alanyl-D-alanine carboxypeptidase [Litoribacter ruber]|uniref:D-alanyl-D-alanine carboxypeptidase n=1 Tax=Litoribacter ruber TaxID=702568 RepID=UPI001BDA5107|nr:D-alanyl-D-alanine carboxypeptidase [Litoribacter ruber]MBT0812669.1 D-alanyl-D-alanine carboxypeptidase [Litoribacter ruber]
MSKYLITALVLIITLQAEAQRLNKRQVKRIFDRSEIMQEHFVGFVLYDQEKERVIYEENSQKYFLPASNTKLFTLYAALNMLGDSIPALRYEERGDSLIVWGTGDPTFLHEKFEDQRAFDFLKNQEKTIYLSIDRDGSSVLEPSNWRADINSIPIAANTAQVMGSAEGFRSFPASIAQFIKQDTALLEDKFILRRAKVGYDLNYPALPIPEKFESKVLYTVGSDLTAQILADTLQKEVRLTNIAMPEDARTLYSVPTDSLLKHMMLPSDNFLAEQILMLCSSTLDGEMGIKKAIDHSLENFMADLPAEPKWSDGSGLSRFNLFTPETIIHLIGKIKDKVGDEDRLKDLMPVGGISGTLKSAYQLDNGVPFVWAKTGTLTYAHLQSGILETRNGKRLRFAFMNNNFVRPTAEIREEMVRIMTEIHERF